MKKRLFSGLLAAVMLLTTAFAAGGDAAAEQQNTSGTTLTFAVTLPDQMDTDQMEDGIVEQVRTVLEDRLEQLALSDAQITFPDDRKTVIVTLPDGADMADMGSFSGAGGTAGSGGRRVSNDSTKLTVYDMLDQEVQENKAAYEEAVENYEDARATAESSLAQAQTSLELLKVELEEAQIEYEKQQVNSQNDRDAAVSESSRAQETYQTEMDRINDEISVALNAKEEAEENLQEFEEVIGDGYLYTTSAGTVMMVNV